MVVDSVGNEVELVVIDVVESTGVMVRETVDSDVEEVELVSVMLVVSDDSVIELVKVIVEDVVSVLVVIVESGDDDGKAEEPVVTVLESVAEIVEELKSIPDNVVVVSSKI